MSPHFQCFHNLIDMFGLFEAKVDVHHFHFYVIATFRQIIFQNITLFDLINWIKRTNKITMQTISFQLNFAEIITYLRAHD